MSFIVFSVENADRLTLMGPPIAGQPTFKPIALSFIQAPKQAKRVVTGEFGPEEPCAYEAAELIRTAFIGKPVKYKEDYVIEALKRSAGRLTLSNGQDASQMLLSAGLATIPDRIPPHMDRALFASYSKMMNEARTAQRGIFAPDASKHVRHLHNYSVNELTKLANELNGKEELIRVERALSGTILIISSAEVLGPTQVATHMTGVTSKETDLSDIAAQSKLHTERFLLHRNVKVHFDGVDSFGNILISIVSPKGTFQEELLSRGLATINLSTLPFASRAEQMQEAENSAKNERKGVWKRHEEATESKKPVVVVAGVASSSANTKSSSSSNTNAGPLVVTASSSSSSSPHTAETTSAVESKAKANGKNETASTMTKLQHGIIAMKPDGAEGPPYTGPIHFTGILVQAIHGDTLVIRDDNESSNGTHSLIRVSLAGVRTSKNIVRDKDGKAAEARVTYHDCAWEAREFVRTHFIGDRVSVKVECARVMPETQEIRPSATVTIPEKGVNIGVALIESGFASFFLGKNETCESPEILQGAEEDAQESMKGQFANPPLKPITVVELSHLGEARARHYLSFLQRGMQGNRPPVLRGVVDLVLGPSSLRVYIAKENFQIPVKVAGIITPNAALNVNDKADPFAEEARDFVIRLLQQREVNVQVYTSDRVGNFICSVCLLDGTNVSVALVSAGLATVGNADKLPFLQQLHDAEEEAKEAKRCIWSGSDTRPQRSIKMENERAMSGINSKSGNIIAITDDSATFESYTISDVAEDGVSVYLQSSSAEAKESLRKMQGLINRTASQAEYVPRRNELVITQFAEDKTWCRARVRYVQRESGNNNNSNSSSSAALVEVLFIDYGNVDTVQSKKVRSIPTTPEYSIVRDTAPLACHSYLAFISPHLPSDAYETATCDAVYGYAEGDVLAKPIYRDAGNNNNMYYTITTDEKLPSLSETLLQAGLALLDKRVEHLGLAEYKKHEAAKEIARKNHKELWEYGDVDDDDMDRY